LRRSALLAAPLLLLAAPAQAQFGASVGLQSDYVYRGHSLSERRPSLSLNLAYDHPGGAYAGATLIAPVAHDEDLSRLGIVGYAGYAAALGSGPSIDLGVSASDLIGYRYPKHRVSYQEVYAGLVGDHLSFHVHYSPDYFQTGAKTLYTDLDGAIRPTDAWRIFAHLGAITPLDAPRGPGSRKERYDVSLGVARAAPHSEVSLAWVNAAPAPRAEGKPQDRAAVVLSLAYFF